MRHNLQLMLAAFIVASIASCGGALFAFTVVRVLQPSWLPLPLNTVTCRWLGLEPVITMACGYIHCSHECIIDYNCILCLAYMDMSCLFHHGSAPKVAEFLPCLGQDLCSLGYTTLNFVSFVCTFDGMELGSN